MPKVSICLPVCNGEKHLTAALQSALNQTEPDFELIVVDDCSDDTSWSIIEKFAAGDARIRASRNERRLGLFENYNRCISQAQGEYLKLFAQDDLLAPDLSERMLQAFAKNPTAVLVTAGKVWIDEGGHAIKSVVQFPEDRLIRGKDAILYNLIRLTNWVGEPSTAMFKRAAAGNGFDTKFFHWGDLDYWFQMLRSGDLFYIARPLVSFRRHQASTTSSNLKGLFFVPDIFRLGEKYEDILLELGETSEQFKERAVEMIAMEVKHLVDDENLTDTEVCAVRNRHSSIEEPHEYTVMRQALFHSSSAVARLLHDLHIARETIRYRDKEIGELQQTISGITNSKVWKITAPLRNMSKSRQ